MIIFYNKRDGQIIGHIDGRLHDDKHLNMWMGNPEETDRLVIQWEKKDDVYQPNHEQQDIIKEIERTPRLLFDYRIKDAMLIQK